MAGWNPNSFYDGSSNYGWTPATPGGGEYYDSPQAKTVLEPTVPRGAFTRWLSGQNATGTGRRDLFAQSLFSKAQQGWEAAQLSNPYLLFRDYLGGLSPNFVDDQWAKLTPEQRGESPQKYAGPVRWMSRG